MANVLTDLAADIYAAADTVGRELVGVIPSCTINSNATEVAAQGEVIRAAFTQAQAVTTVAPAMTIPEGTDQTVDNKTMTLSSTASVKIPWTGENIKYVNNGAGFDTIYGDQIKQAMRAITNQIETEVALDIADRASRAVGTAGTTPFASNFNVVAEVRQVLVDNGMPSNDRQATLVINSAAGTKLRNLASLSSVNTSGNEDMLRRGTLLDLQGLQMKESAGIDSHTAGTGSSATTDDAGYAVGATVLTLASAGTGTLLAGDVVSFAGDSNSYVVVSGDADVSGGGTITLAAPGLRVAMSAATKAITVVASSARNMAFNRSALVLAARAPARPEEGDMAEDVIVITDPRSGLSMEFAMYKGYRKVRYEVGLAWGVKNIKPEHTALLLG